MPIKTQNDLPVKEILERENINNSAPIYLRLNCLL